MEKAQSRSFVKKAVSLLATVALVAASSLSVTALAPQGAQAANAPYMKTLKLKWDLKKSQTYKVKETWSGLGKKTVTAKVKTLKTVKSSKKGYKKTTFSVTFTRPFVPSKKQVHTCVNSSAYKKSGVIASDKYFAVVDYDSGKSLEVDNEFDVSVKSTWKHTKQRKVTDSHGCWVRTAKYATAKVTITYPDTYKGVCIGIGGNNLLSPTNTDNAFWSGNAKFGKTSLYKKSKTNSHWIHLK